MKSFLDIPFERIFSFVRRREYEVITCLSTETQAASFTVFNSGPFPFGTAHLETRCIVIQKSPWFIRLRSSLPCGILQVSKLSNFHWLSRLYGVYLHLPIVYLICAIICISFVLLLCPWTYLLFIAHISFCLQDFILSRFLLYYPVFSYANVRRLYMHVWIHNALRTISSSSYAVFSYV